MKNTVKEALELGAKPVYQYGLLLDYFKRNPGVILSVAYVLLTLCGIFYSMEFYRGFDINILKLAHVADLLIVGISEPAAILMFSGGLLMAWGADKLMMFSYPIQQRWRQKPKSIKRTLMLMINYVPKHKEGMLLTFVFIFVAYAFIFVTLYAEWRSDDVKNSDADFIIVKTEGDDQGNRYKLLGSTANFLLVYEVDQSQSRIIPIEQVVEMVPEKREQTKNSE